MKKEKTKKLIIDISIYLLIFLSLLIGYSTKWCINNYGNLKVDELIFHLKVPLTGTGSNFILDFIKSSLIPSFIWFIIIFLLIIIIFTDIFNKKIYLIIKVKSKIRKILIYPYSKFKKYLIIIFSLLFLIVLYFCMQKLNIIEYLKDQSQNSTFIEENYVDPKMVKYNFPDKKRNLIYIMVESLEGTYFNKELGGYQDYNLLEELLPLMNEGINFSNTEQYGGALQIEGVGWTVGAMVAQTSGVPLKIPIEGNSYNKYSTFMPGAYSLGEVLEKNGYYQEIIMGSKSSFAGRNLYYKQHGNYEIWDYYTALNKNKFDNDYYVWWGFEDSKLYEYAKEELLEIKDKNKPFNFSLLTANTHHPNGYLESSCELKYDNNYSNVISCASKQLYDFIKWIKNQDFYENTTIIVVGDHLSMDPTFFTNIDNYDRTVFNLIINSPISAENTKNRLFSTLDLFPTTLAALNVKMSSNKLGLGVNLFSDEKTILEENGIDKVNNEINKRSKFYNEKLLYKK